MERPTVAAVPDDKSRTPSVAKFIASQGDLEVDPAFEHDAAIPGKLASSERVILTGGEGIGKTEFLLQVATQVATGYPVFESEPKEFDDPEFDDPVNVLLVDLENDPRQLAIRLKRLESLVPPALEWDRSNLLVYSKPQGLTSFRPSGLSSSRPEYHEDFDDDDWDELHDAILEISPNLVCIGPLYKASSHDIAEDGPARDLIDRLEYISEGRMMPYRENGVRRYLMMRGPGLLIEAHMVKADSRANRPITPYGHSVFIRWPSFGLHLGDDGAITHWREPRVRGREWPVQLRRGDRWPWEAVKLERDERIADVEEVLRDYLKSHPLNTDRTIYRCRKAVRDAGIKIRAVAIDEVRARVLAGK